MVPVEVRNAGYRIVFFFIPLLSTAISQKDDGIFGCCRVFQALHLCSLQMIRGGI